MRDANGDSRHRIVVLALPGVMSFDLGTATQIFRVARARDDRGLYRIRVTTPDGAPVRATGGFAVVPEHPPEAIETADTLLVPGVHSPLLTGEPLEPGTRDLLRAAAERGTRMVSICTGAFALAAAGLLDGRRAATHWAHAASFRRLFPAVRLDPDVLFVDEGDVLTSAGVGAGIDLCLHVVRRDHGSAVANRAARRCVVPPWRDGGQAQYVERPVPGEADSSTASTRAYLLENLDERIDLPRMAAHARMSVRTFSRRFRAETGLAPNAWLLQQRVEHARHLLEETDLPVDGVARAAGFGSTAALRQHLRAVVGVSPLSYRRTFRRTP